MNIDETPTFYAHEIAPEPTEDAPVCVDHVRYQLARAYGLWRGWSGQSEDMLSADPVVSRRYHDRLNLVSAETHLALLMAAVHNGEGDPLTWAHDRAQEEGAEWVWGEGFALGLDMDRIRPYPLAAP